MKFILQKTKTKRSYSLFSPWHLQQQKNPSNHSSWWRSVEDVFSAIFFCLHRRLQSVLNTSSRHVCKTSSWRPLEDVFKTSWGKRLEDVLKTSLEGFLQTRLENALKMCWRRLGSWEIVTLKRPYSSIHRGKQEIFSGRKKVSSIVFHANQI